MSDYRGKKRHKNQSEQTIPEVILLGIFKGLWWLISWPFRRGGQRSSGLSVQGKQYIISKRQEIERMLGSDNEYELKHAVIEADKLVDYLMQLKGYAGESFADRLRSAEHTMGQAQYQQLWDSHKIRNQIAHQDGHIDNNTVINAAKSLLEYTK